MTARTQSTTGRIARLRKLSVAGVATAGAAAAALTLAPSPAHAAEQASVSAASGRTVAAEAPAKKAKKAKQAKKEKKQYKDNLDGWIREALDIMESEDIPGSYEGLHRNIMRESGGNPNAQNNWDVNAQNGTPSKGLLQVIQPTFDAYHVKGTKHDVTDPVANLTAAANYAADRYGSIDNVDSAY
ncbi:transglycosylase SLT domain-containing protein [Streptomyces sp. HNM0645]|uniref:transglycosylase SLT domain-containing protein n=1 Tax=Streptomyces sp. HNM0645 TaxID=2782343 RepID=UPI0024B6699E|nr:transglycosylase SLT domain-containing protein [Streptomyces sp. HNM0645]MDI9885503.1 transglycosylase SLT domain-containing protein [Streptomyces sp. HNM0645]